MICASWYVVGNYTLASTAKMGRLLHGELHDARDQSPDLHGERVFRPIGPKIGGYDPLYISNFYQCLVYVLAILGVVSDDFLCLLVDCERDVKEGLVVRPPAALEHNRLSVPARQSTWSAIELEHGIQ